MRIRSFIFSCLLITGLKSYAQDTTVTKLYLDSTWQSILDSALNSLWDFNITPSILITPFSSFNYLDHNPDKSDERNLKRYKRFINRKPNSKNNTKYFSLAYSLWDFNRLAEAEKMFLAVVESEDEFYTSAYYHSSDIPGDTITNIYGYGSFTSNYKNEAALQLTKIYLEQKQFDKALKYLEDAVNKYPETYTCGTAFLWQRNEYDFLYASCYLGLNRNKDVLNILLPKCLERSDDIIIKAIKNIYTEKEIDTYLTEAENSVVCNLDSFPSYSYLTTEISKTVEKTDTIEYYSGNATILLFGTLIDMPIPDLEKDEHLTKESVIKLYKESDFYNKLKKEKDVEGVSQTRVAKD